MIQWYYNKTLRNKEDFTNYYLHQQNYINNLIKIVCDRSRNPFVCGCQEVVLGFSKSKSLQIF